MTGDSPFELDKHEAYRRWRERKLATAPARIDDLLVDIRDPRGLSAAEHAAILDRCRNANMAIYASHAFGPDKEIPRAVGRQLGLTRLDCNWLADDDGISPIAVSGDGSRPDFIPYTNRPIKWHTDGYYNPPGRRILGMVLHCVQSAAAGGENALLDHEIAYLLLRDQDPEHIRALTAPDAMTIPERTDENGVARAAETGPVFWVDPASGALAMRYTARTRSIEWKADAATRAAVAALERLLADPDSPYIFRGRLEPGMGLVCNNVLHDRAGFTDDPQQPRLLYRARYYDRIAGSAALLAAA